MRRYSALFIVFICAQFAFADSNSIIDDVLSKDRVSFSQAVWLVCNAAELVPETASIEDAIASARTQGWVVPENPGETSATLGDYSFLLMSALKLKGGIMYTLAPGARYALRELIFLKAVRSPAWPSATMSGEEALRILQKVLDIKEKRK